MHLAVAVSLRRVEVSYHAQNSCDKVLASSDLQPFALPSKPKRETKCWVDALTTSDNRTFLDWWLSCLGCGQLDRVSGPRMNVHPRSAWPDALWGVNVRIETVR